MESESKTRNIIAIDIEADGQIPGLNSMLALGAAAYDPEGVELGALEIHLEPWPGAYRHTPTMEWWAKRKAAWEHIQANRVPPADAMKTFSDWIKLYDPVVYLCGPVGFDFTFVRWYMVQYGYDFPHNAIDLRSYIMGAVGDDDYYGGIRKKVQDATGLRPIKHTHIALDDAREIASYFFAIKKWQKEQRVADAKKKIRGIFTASKQGVNAPELESIKEEVMQNIFGQDPGTYMITDESRIGDFVDYGERSRNLRTKELNSYHAQIREEYGIEIPEGGYLVDVFREIYESRRPKH